MTNLKEKSLHPTLLENLQSEITSRLHDKFRSKEKKSLHDRLRMIKKEIDHSIPEVA